VLRNFFGIGGEDLLVIAIWMSLFHQNSGWELMMYQDG
jgi:hypothetical protein